MDIITNYISKQVNPLNNDFVYIHGATPCYQSRLFIENEISHGFFTRKGGVSTGPFESLNFAVGVGELQDDEARVMQNYQIAAETFGLNKEDVCRTYQTHTSVVEWAEEKDRGRGISIPPYDHGVDGLVTRERNLLLSVRTADCVPVLLCDKEKRVCSAVHAGWRGTVGGITKNAVNEMAKIGVDTSDILAAIGPCVGACCYEVGGEVRDEFLAISPQCDKFFTPKNGKYMLDLVGANEFILVMAGIKPENISSANLCTKCNEAEFFSHRRSGSVRGTMSAFIHI